MNGPKTETAGSRIASLEAHLAHQARAIEELDETVREQWRLIDGLRRELMALRDRFDAATEGGAELPDRPPPHY